ncbi:MAG: 2-dehydropantoate 2-reductase N-terminal domain-containing protein [Planctomycetota bacterium]
MLTKNLSVAVIGAGALGLGFLGAETAHQATALFIDIEARRDTLEAIERKRSYVVNFAGTGIRPQTIENVRALLDFSNDAKANAVADADLVFTAVGAGNLSRIAPWLRNAAQRRTKPGPLVALCAENGIDIAKKLSALVNDNERFIAMDTVMGRMSRLDSEPDAGYRPLFDDRSETVVVEPFYGIPYHRLPTAPDLPFDVLQPRDAARFDYDEHIKLFAHNCLHGVFAIYALKKGKKTLADVSDDPVVLDRAHRMLNDELLPALIRLDAGAFEIAEYQNYAVHLVRRLVSRSFSDTVARGVRGAKVKLEPGERWQSAIDFLLKAGIKPVGYIDSVADMVEESDELKGMTLETALRDICRFDPPVVNQLLSIRSSAVR